MRASRLLVAAVVIVATIALVAACGSSKTSDTHTGGRTKTKTVVQTVTATAPTTSTAAATTPTKTTKTTNTSTNTTTTTNPVATSNECNVTDLAATELEPNGAAGTQILTFTLKNIGAGVCDTYGWPGIGFLSSSGALLPTTPKRVTHDALGSTGAPVKLSLDPGQEVSFRVMVTLTGSGSSCVNASKIEITPPDDKPTLTLKLKPEQPTCGNATVTPLQAGTAAVPAGT